MELLMFMLLTCAYQRTCYEPLPETQTISPTSDSTQAMPESILGIFPDVSQLCHTIIFL